MPMSRLALRFWLGSSTSPPLITKSNLSFGPMAATATPPVAARARPDAECARNRRRESAIIAFPPIFPLLLGREAAPPPRRDQGNCQRTEAPGTAELLF